MPKTYEQLKTVKYPSDLNTSKNDFVQFSHFKYELNENATNPSMMGS